MKKQIWIKVLSVLMVCTLLAGCLAGCGSKTQESEAKPEEAVEEPAKQETPEETVPAEKEPAAEPESEPEDDTLVIAMPADIGTCDAHNYYTSTVVQNWLYETLTMWEDNHVVPGLAASWDISDDGTLYTFHLRENVKFTDGSDWNAEIAKKNIDAVLMHKQDHSWMKALEQIETVEAVDALTLAIQLKSPYYPFLQEISLARPLSFIAEAAFPDSGDTLADPVKAPIGTGPLKLVEHVTDEYALFERNEDYWGDPVQFKYVRVEVIPDANTQVAALKSGDIDLIFDLNGSLTADTFYQLQDEGFTTAVSDPVNTLFIAINSGRGPTADLNVRLAMEHAVDKQALTEGVFQGLVTPADHLFDPSLPYCDVDAATYNYDPDLSRQLLDEAGWVLEDGQRFRTKGGETLSVAYYYDGTKNTSRTMGEVLQSMFEEVGIEMTLFPEDMMALFNRSAAGDFDLLSEQTGGGQYDPHTIAATFLAPGHCHFAAQAGMQAPSKEELDSWINELLLESNEAKIQEDYAKVINAITDQAIYLPILGNRVVAVGQKDLEGITFNTVCFIPLQTLHHVAE